MKTLMLKDNGQVVSTRYNVTVGYINKDDSEKWKFNKVPYTTRLDANEEEQICWILYELGGNE
ncbi:hypothetical protein VPHG_00183 [Vibrio phage 11895-B1]|uniref:hypothetical protein n=1 Tax=Vibrio phage 11895-B1 TaxID=754075 RepID=UPI0002C0A02D|nr:hypothetical protein VPHG_00183 [Vibrio phage 11895-B1]AGH32246.1 hypothetical protein VPHG_00183 [Vibrio phage 11895-B1]